MLDYDTGIPNRFSRTEGRITGSAYGVAYPSPFFDVAHTYLPASIKQMFRWCRYYTLTNPLIAATVNKMAEYPVTDIVVDDDNEGVRRLWIDFFNDVLKLRSFLIDIGLFYMTYGNALVSISYPFKKFLKCKVCDHQVMAKEVQYNFRSFRFFMECPKCKHQTEAAAFDVYVKSPSEIRLLLWNPEDITIRHNDLTGKDTYYYTMPQFLVNEIKMGKRETVESVPQVFIDAVKKQKSIILSHDNIFHFRKPSILSAGRDRGWGIPLVLPVLKDTFYLQVLKKAQECVAPDTLIETPSGLVTADDLSVGDLVRTHTGAWHEVEEKWYRDSRDEEVGRKITLASMRGIPSTYSPKHPVFSIARNDLSRRKDTKEQQRSSVILRNPHLYEEVLRPADQLNVGDYVLYPRRLPTTAYAFDASRYLGLPSTDEYVYSGGCSIETVRAFEKLESGGDPGLGEGNEVKVAKRILKEGRTPKRIKRKVSITPQLGYILGWYAGDGSYGKGHISISMGLDDDPKEFCNAVVETFGVEPKTKSVGSILSVDVNDVIVSKLIKGLVPGTARHKKVPKAILDSSNEAKVAFLRGLWEADGYIDRDRAILNTSSRDLAYDTYRMLIHLGCIANVVDTETPPSELPDGRVIKATAGFRVAVSTKSRDRLVNLFAGTKPAEVVSGKSGFFWGEDYFASRVCSVEEVEEDTYIDFKIANDTTFCTPASATKNSIALERIVPLSVLFPQPGSGTSDPYATISLSKWREQVSLEIQRWRFDRNYMPIMPLPIGHQVIGGDGRALLLGAEINIWAEHIIAGMGVPKEFIFGGLQYSGSNVSLRMLENHFLRYISDMLRLIKSFIVPNVAAYMDWPTASARFKPFKMADDLQRRAFDFQLNAAGKLSDTTLLANCDYEQVKEDDLIHLETERREEAVKKSQIASATIQGEMSLVQAKYQARAQAVIQREQQQAMIGEAQGAPGEAQEGGYGQSTAIGQQQGAGPQQPPIEFVVEQVARRVAMSPPEYHEQLLQQVAQQNPELASKVRSKLRQMTSGASSGMTANQSASRPMPEQLPPRRGSANAII